MNTAPKIGARVKFAGNSVIPACEGVVECVYPSDEVTYPDGDDGDAVPTGRYLPQRAWKVSVRPDELPQNWPYPGAERFAAEVSQLSAA